MPARGPLETAKIRPRVVAWALDGKTDREIVVRLRRLRPPVHVTHQAIARFRARHADELTRREEQVAERVVGVTIAQKEERIRRAEVVGLKLMEWIEQYGPVTVTYHEANGQTSVEHRFNKGLVDALVNLQKYVAEEAGELPKRLDPPPPPAEERVNEFRTLVLGDSAVRELAQQLFAAIAVGTRDAGGAGMVRERRRLDPGEAPDAGE